MSITVKFKKPNLKRILSVNQAKTPSICVWTDYDLYIFLSFQLEIDLKMNMSSSQILHKNCMHALCAKHFFFCSP